MNASWRFYLIAALSLAACEDPASEAGATAEETPPAASPARLRVDPALLASGRVHLTEVAFRPPDDEVVAPGRVVGAPRGEALVSAALSGQVREVHVREGERVERDQPLATLAAPDLAKLQGEIAAAHARRTAAKAIVDQEERLLTARATSERAVLAAKSELASAVAAERMASGQLAAYRGAGDVLRAPIAGVVAHRGVSLGQHVAPGEQLFHIVDPATLEVRAEVPSDIVALLEEGSEGHLWPLGAETGCTGKVVMRGAAVEPGTTRVAVHLRPGEDCPPMLVGSFVETRLHRESNHAPVLVVPREAVIELDGVTSVFVPSGAEGEFRFAPVDVSRYNGRWAYLRSGVKAGEKVVDRGTILLKGEWMRGALEE
ncbi:MAG: efflux RND transporter periplasmic adaptor subunit [Polyangiaceae bacterium]